VFERFQRISDPRPEACDICGEGPVEVVLYPVPVHFKGSGFYSTDYGRGSRRQDGSNEAGDGGEGTKKDDKKDEKKAAAAD
jgi:predicted nucleic acid-binding Zn ribbon protein